jgi:murein DD-endopeptidase MepM/ murein hydrolase activator NlpD
MPRQQPTSTVLPAAPLTTPGPYEDTFSQINQFRQSVRTVSHRISPGDSLYQILLNHGVPTQEVGQLIASTKSHLDVQKFVAGEVVELFFGRDSRQLEKVRYQEMSGQVLAITASAWGWVVSRYARPMVITTTLGRGTIKDSLYQSAQDEGIDFDLAMALADIFAWDIDFYVDLRPSDHYIFIYEKRFRDGDFAGNGRIMAAHFHNGNTHHRAYYYEVPGKGGDYYDEGGRSLRKQFLKSPLRYTRISSGFSKRRLHPILKIHRPHLGIDYAAPVGTPVQALGDGRVTFKGWKGGYGRFIEIRHNSRYTTTYAHLSRYGSKVKKGRAVKQGQVIGYVGSSGLSTGPHLDFRMKRDGSYVNPLRLRFPTAQPVPPTYLAEFQHQVAFLEGKLKNALAQGPGLESPLPLAVASGGH